jgi:methylmalonyl-CoA/ethylmalonyl-CoA epimerase
VKFRLNHIGLVAKSIDEFARVFRSMGMDVITEPVPDPVQKVSASFVNACQGYDVHIEILEPTAEDSPIANFLRKRGGGLHHLCFEVDDIREASNMLVEKGFRMVSQPVECGAYDLSLKRQCSNTSKIAFFLIHNRMLVELIEMGR